MANKRIIDQTTTQTLSSGDYVMVDSSTDGSRKYALGTALAGINDDLSDIGDLSSLETTAKSTLVDAINEIAEGGGGGGLTDEERALILSLFSKAAYAEDDAGDACDQLSSLWAVYTVTWAGSGYTHGNASTSAKGGSTYVSTITASGGHEISTVVATMGGVTVQGAWNNGTVTIPNVTGNIVITVTTAQATVSSISAIYTQSGTVYNTDSLDTLKSDLVVTATYVDQTTYVVPSTDYDLSGTLTVGTSTVTVSYGGKTTTFTVTVSVSPYAQDLLDGVTWHNGYGYNGSGVMITQSNTYCTDKIDDSIVQDQLYHLATTNQDTSMALLMWDENDTFLGRQTEYPKDYPNDLMRYQLKPNLGYKYAVQIYNDSSFDSSLITFKVIDNRDEYMSEFELNLADYITETTKISDGGLELNITSGMTANGITSSNYLTAVNKMSLFGAFGKAVSRFPFTISEDRIGLATYGSSILCTYRTASISATTTNLEAYKQYVTNNAIKLKINY